MPCTIQCIAHYVLYMNNIELKNMWQCYVLFIIEHEMCSTIHKYVEMQHNIYCRAQNQLYGTVMHYSM